MQGAFWGMLFGLIFFVPFFDLAVGAAFGALGAKMADYGISDDIIKKTRDQVTERYFRAVSAHQRRSAKQGHRGSERRAIRANFNQPDQRTGRRDESYLYKRVIQSMELVYAEPTPISIHF
jgi:uncharacterized membrane protein